MTMKLSLAVLGLTLGAASAVPDHIKKNHAQGFDVSKWQGDVEFGKAYESGARFVIIKATEGTDYTSDPYKQQRKDATQNDFIRGAYHFALPNSSCGKQQATFFANNGGDWIPDGITLPGMLDLEANPYDGGKCYGKNHKAMVAWIQEFIDTYKAQVGRPPMIYTSNDVWEECTGNSDAFVDQAPLVLAYWADKPVLPEGTWENYTFWQYTNEYKFGGDGQYFNGNLEKLKKFAFGCE